MQVHKMSDAEALRFIHPKRRSDRRALLRLCGFIVLIAACAGALYYNNRQQQMIRERDWISAVALIDDARTHVAMRVDSERGGTMLYDLDVLVKYSTKGRAREQWTTLHQHPQPLADAELQIFRLKKQQCIVRWDPADPDHIVAEIN